MPEDVRIEEVSPQEVPGWDSPDQRASRAYGDAWYDQRRTAVLIVPSMVTLIERNVVIHQEHPDFARISAGGPQPVRWDARLMGR